MIRKTIIIAEAGVNHNGSLDLALKLVDAAADAGADYVKFQTFRAAELVTQSAAKADYQIKASGNAESQFEMLLRLELTEKMHHELIAHCNKRNIGFLSTGFDIESVNFLVKVGQKLFKVPSGEITNLPYLQHIGKLGLPIILSTGMATLGDIEAAIDIFEKAGTSRSKITVLHCTTEYPAPIEGVNLRAMQSIGLAFGVDIGYSDHTNGIEVPIAAVALGAKIIEKHFTLDRKLPGPDHQASLEPSELNAMVAAIRNVEIALGDGVKRLSSGEALNKRVVRKSLVAKKAIKVGEIFTHENVDAKRPGTGISPMRLNEVIGRTALRAYVVDEQVEL